ncbi:hypothetical protein PUR61_03125, partial [Streptomyces sp. BE20]|uniref:hypothetical protein n=1 Tax=Streptomyces sp. BE20 TaxID=3002525 RepID=UPI002E77D916
MGAVFGGGGVCFFCVWCGVVCVLFWGVFVCLFVFTLLLLVHFFFLFFFVVCFFFFFVLFFVCGFFFVVG